MPQQVAPARTPITPLAMWPIMAARWDELAPEPPTSGQLMILMSQWCLETGNGVDMIQWNVGNVKHVQGDGLDWCNYLTTEGSGADERKVIQSFKAYASAEAGVDAFLNLFLIGRYSNAWPFALDGDVDGFAQALKDRGYYTASEASYDVGMRARLKMLEAIGLPALPTD